MVRPGQDNVISRAEHASGQHQQICTSSMPSLGINELTYLMSLFTHHFSLGSFPLPDV